VVVPADKPFITFRGEDAAATIITQDTNLGTVDATGRKLTALESATVLVEANNFTAEKITFENTTPLAQHIQALAMYVTGDRAVFRGCRFLGWQDTLRADSPKPAGAEPDVARPNGNARQYFTECYVEGHVDFIYGASTAVFDRCHLHGKADGYITAASTPRDVAHGYVFLDCRITVAAEATNGLYLGRPWRSYAAVAFLRTEIPLGVRPEGWENWKKPENEKTARYAEYRNTGPGARPEARVPWSHRLTDEEAKAYTVENILRGADGWNPVP
jgi:pectinesterase